jgi:hypothetical protein
MKQKCDNFLNLAARVMCSGAQWRMLLSHPKCGEDKQLWQRFDDWSKKAYGKSCLALPHFG